MNIIDLSFGIPSQVWAAVQMLSVDVDAAPSEYEVFTMPFSQPAGRIKGFLISWVHLSGKAMNVTVTESGGGDTMWVMHWRTERRARSIADRPDNATAVEFKYGDIVGVSSEVIRLARQFMK